MRNKRRAFTIIELAIVVVIVVMIGVATLGGISKFRNRNLGNPNAPASASGVTKASVKVETNSAGLTTEQQNIVDRYKMDNEPGSVKHLYIVSAFSGDVVLYSTVKGKVTSSKKRLTPVTVSSGMGVDSQAINSDRHYGIPVNIGGSNYRTGEVLQDDGTYGSSAEYVYWWDVRDIYHQHYISGGQIVHISNQPLAFPKIILNLETQALHSAEPLAEVGSLSENDF